MVMAIAKEWWLCQITKRQGGWPISMHHVEGLAAQLAVKLYQV